MKRLAFVAVIIVKLKPGYATGYCYRAEQLLLVIILHVINHQTL